MIRNIVAWIFFLPSSLFQVTRLLTFRVILVLLSVVAIFWLSVFIYLKFYVSYLPILKQSLDVNLQFSSDCTVNSKCRFPHSNIGLYTSNTQMLIPGQEYSMNMILHLPESSTNLQLGNFMVRLKVLSNKGHVTQSTARAVRIEYSSYLLQMLELLFFIPLYLLRFRRQTQVIHVPLFQSFVENPYHPTSHASVVIESREVEVYHATLEIEAKLSGIRYLILYWPVSSFLVGVSFIFVVLLLLLMASCSREKVAADSFKDGRETTDESPCDQVEEIKTKTEDDNETGGVRQRTAKPNCA